ncbi:MAG: DNA-3-methyladenine glycosylase [Acetobacteraceae bacterium]
MSVAAMRHLSVDPVWARLIARVGKPRLEIARDQSPFEALMRAIAHQQLHGRAARAITARFVALYPEASFPTPAQVIATDEAVLRGCGFSAAKVATLRSISAHALEGIVPSRAAAARLSDDVLIERLTQIRGVGRWTVEMLLIFTLGRPDILPVDDYGVREGYRVLHGLDAQPKPRALATIGEAWAPHRSRAAWYLWRAAELATDATHLPAETDARP